MSWLFMILCSNFEGERERAKVREREREKEGERERERDNDGNELLNILTDYLLTIQNSKPYLLHL